MKKILEAGVLLSSERDLPKLLEKLLSCVMELARCDAGTLYLLDGDVLRFKILRNDTMGVCQGGDGQDPGLPPVPMRRENVCAGNATQALLWGSYKQEAASSGSHPI